MSAPVDKITDFDDRRKSLLGQVERDTERFQRDAARHGKLREAEILSRLPLGMLLAERGIIPVEHVNDFARGTFENRRMCAIIAHLLTGKEHVESPRKELATFVEGLMQQ